MEIEKISENQIKFILNQSDLKERNIKIGELAYCSEKTEELFKEMMTQAMMQYDFCVDNTPLMIEAIPASADSIIIIVTKVSATEDIQDRLNLFSDKSEFSKIKRKLKLDTKSSDNNEQTNYFIYSFDSLEILTALSKRIYDIYDETTANVYKYQSRYYLLIKISPNEIEYNNVITPESLLSEYGQKHIYANVSQFFLDEHAEILIKDNAISILATYL